VSRNIAAVEESMSNGTGLQRRPMVVKPAVISCSGHYCRKAKVVVDGGKGYEDSQAKAKERQRAEVEAFPDRHIIRPFQPQIREHDEKERRREDRGKAGQVSTAEEKPGNERVTANEREVDSGEQEEDSQRVREVPYTAVGGGPPVHSPEDEENRERNLCRDALFQANEEAVDGGSVERTNDHRDSSLVYPRAEKSDAGKNGKHSAGWFHHIVLAAIKRPVDMGEFLSVCDIEPAMQDGIGCKDRNVEGGGALVKRVVDEERNHEE